MPYIAPASVALPCAVFVSASVFVTVRFHFFKTLSNDLCVTLFHSIGAVCFWGTTYLSAVSTSSSVYGLSPLTRTFSNFAMPSASVVAYKSTLTPLSEVP